MAISVDTSGGWMPEKSLLDSQQVAILDNLIRWAEESKMPDDAKSQTHWIQGFAGSGKTILLIYAMLQTIRLQPDAKICFVTYTSALKDLVLSALKPDGDEAVEIIRFDQMAEAIKSQNRFDYVFVDEVQDIKKSHLKLLIRSTNRLVIAGDPDQSIYQNRVSEKELQEALKVPDDCLYELSILYRLPPKVVAIANTILPETKMIFAENGRRGEPGTAITTHYTNKQKEAETVYKYADELSTPKKPSLILLPSHGGIYDFAKLVCKSRDLPPPPESVYRGMRDYSEFNQSLKDNGLNLMYFGNDNGDLNVSKVHGQTYIMTYHSAKGLDFPQVFLPGLNVDLTIWRDNEIISKRLFFVGITRTSKDLYMSFNSHEPHRYLNEVEKLTGGMIEFEGTSEPEKATQASPNPVEALIGEVVEDAISDKIVEELKDAIADEIAEGLVNGIDDDEEKKGEDEIPSSTGIVEPTSSPEPVKTKEAPPEPVKKKQASTSKPAKKKQASPFKPVKKKQASTSKPVKKKQASTSKPVKKKQASTSKPVETKQASPEPVKKKQAWWKRLFGD
ncbi:UvrD-helicase domain-containing protein [Rhodospirillales bacterium]|nr:UvrD-helicase domain-containing protein [Rhodospirillales bacterium]